MRTRNAAVARSHPSPQTAESPCGASKATVQRSIALLFVTCLAAPGIASAQTDIVSDAASVPVPAAPPPLRLFKDIVPESSGRSLEAVKSFSFWEAPARGSEVPRWTIGQTVALNTTGGFALTAGFFGRRADPLPLFLSQGATSATQRAITNSVTDPDTYRLRWDVKFGVTASLRNSPQLKINAIGEVFMPLSVPLSESKDAPPPFLTSRAFRFGLKTAF